MNAFKILKNAILIVVPAYTLYSYLKTRRDLANKYKQKKEHHDKHNSVVFYAKDLGMSWSVYGEERVKQTLHNLHLFKEPILYFVNTAFRSLDIAVMTVSLSLFEEPLINALKRGVTVRILTNECFEKSKFNKLKQYGAQILFSGNIELSSIMHLKFMVKDFSPEKSTGYVVFGSINWSLQAFLENYENLVFTTHPKCVMQMHVMFEHYWDYLVQQRRNVIYEVL